MKFIKKDSNIHMNFPEYLPENSTICFLDIETDGLSHFKNMIILIGLHIVTAKESYVIQLFSENNTPREEHDLLKTMTEILEDVDIIYTYNGATFDIPFITKKLNFYEVENDLNNISHIDLIKQIRANKRFLKLENCKLKTVEKHIGIHRDDTISGAESVALYKEYLKTKNIAIENTILRHNFDDILYLPKILEFENSLRKESNLIFALQDIKSNKRYGLIEIMNINMNDRGINIKANTLSGMKSYEIYGNSYTLNIVSSLKSFELNIVTYQCKFSDGSLGQFIDLNTDGLMKCDISSYKNDYNVNLPENILLLAKEDTVFLDNIKNLLTEIVKR